MISDRRNKSFVLSVDCLRRISDEKSWRGDELGRIHTKNQMKEGEKLMGNELFSRNNDLSSASKILESFASENGCHLCFLEFEKAIDFDRVKQSWERVDVKTNYGTEYPWNFIRLSLKNNLRNFLINFCIHFPLFRILRLYLCRAFLIFSQTNDLYCWWKS